MPVSTRDLDELIASDERVLSIKKDIVAYKKEEQARIQGIRSKVAEVSSQIKKLTNRRNGLKRQLKVKQGPLRKLQRKIRTRRNAILSREKNKEWREYAKMFQVRKIKLKV